MYICCLLYNTSKIEHLELLEAHLDNGSRNSSQYRIDSSGLILMFPPVAILFMFLASLHLAKSNWTSCTPVCTCAQDTRGFLRARCNVQSLPDSRLLLLSTVNNLYSLSIANTAIDRIPAGSFQGLHSLREILLKNNSLKRIEEGAFSSLIRLNILDLRDNNLQTWHVNPDNSLPSLQTIHVAGNNHWAPDENLLRLRNLKEITGVKWSSTCRDCTLLKTVKEKEEDESDDMFDANDTISMACDVTLDTFFIHHQEVTYGKAYEFVKLGFSPQCLCNSHECFNQEITHVYFRQLYDIPKKLFYTQYVLGAILLVINLTIVVIVLIARTLRTNASFILICSMALSDVLIGLYTVGIAVFNPFTESTVTPNQMMKNDISMCPYLGFVFTTGQTTTVFTSLFMTVERYLAIVHCDRPSLRMTTKITFILTTVIWVVGVVYAVLPLLGVQELQYHKWFQCTMPFHKSTDVLDDTSTVTLVIAIGFVMVYLASVALYVRIYIYVRTASANFSVGVRREARLAKRIALVVCTNFIFFVVPTILFLVYVYRFMKVLFDVGSTFLSLRGFIVMGSWVPVTLLGLSSLLNPILYAFRHQKFQREINRFSRHLNNHFRDSLISQESRMRRNTSSYRSPSYERRDKRKLLKNANGEHTTDFELSKISSLK